jgi:hypothetical protein
MPTASAWLIGLGEADRYRGESFALCGCVCVRACVCVCVSSERERGAPRGGEDGAEGVAGACGPTVGHEFDARYVGCLCRLAHGKLGRPCLDAHEVIHGGGCVLPLGGATEQTGGHKG